MRYCSTLRVSADRAANRAAHTRGKPRLLDVGRRIPTRDGFAPDSPLEGNGFERSVPRLDSQRFSWVRPSWGQSTGAPVIRAVAGFGTPTELSSGGPRSRHSPPGSGGVILPPRCRRCQRIAEPKVRIRSPPADSPSLAGFLLPVSKSRQLPGGAGPARQHGQQRRAGARQHHTCGRLARAHWRTARPRLGVPSDKAPEIAKHLVTSPRARRTVQCRGRQLRADLTFTAVGPCRLKRSRKFTSWPIERNSSMSASIYL